MNVTELLQSVANCGKLTGMHENCIEGGHVDCYGLSHSRGGCNRAAVFHRDRQADAAQERVTGLQAWQRVAHRQGRVRRMEEAAQEQIQIRTGKLTFVLQIAHEPPKSFARQ